MGFLINGYTYIVRIKSSQHSRRPTIRSRPIAKEVREHWKTVHEALHELLDEGSVANKEVFARLTWWSYDEIPI